MPKPLMRTTRIMNGLLSRRRYDQVVYLAAPAARLVVTCRTPSPPTGGSCGP